MIATFGGLVGWFPASGGRPPTYTLHRTAAAARDLTVAAIRRLWRGTARRSERDRLETLIKYTQRTQAQKGSTSSAMAATCRILGSAPISFGSAHSVDAPRIKTTSFPLLRSLNRLT